VDAYSSYILNTAHDRARDLHRETAEYELSRTRVSGHEILNGDGQRTERWRPRELRGGGHQICLID